MLVEECIRDRKSCRKFLSTEVSEEIIRESIKDAQRAPSYKNSQPWEVVFVTGQKREKLSGMLLELLNSQEVPSPDIPEPGKWPEAIEKRIKETARKRAEAYGIVPGPDSAKKSKEANYSFYNAPGVLFFFQDKSLGEWSLLDMGMFIQNVILGLNARGISTVPQAFLIDYSTQTRKFLGIPESKKLVLGMSLGYPDKSDIKYKYSTQRESLETVYRCIK